MTIDHNARDKEFLKVNGCQELGGRIIKWCQLHESRQCPQTCTYAQNRLYEEDLRYSSRVSKYESIRN